jgi:hypothetical protein
MKITQSVWDALKSQAETLEGATYNPELDKYSGQSLFPEMVAEVKRILEESPFPQELLDMMNRPVKK